MESKILFSLICIALIPALNAGNVFSDLTNNIENAKRSFDNYVTFQDRSKDSGDSAGALLNSLLKVANNLEVTSHANVKGIMTNDLSDAKLAAKTSVVFAQLIGDLDSLEPIFKNSNDYTDVINLFTKNQHAIDTMYYNPFMAAFHVNDVEAWTNFRDKYVDANLAEVVNSVMANQSTILKMLTEKDCNKFDVGKYCAYTFNELLKVLSMRGAAQAAKDNSKVDSLSIDGYSVLSACSKALSAC